MKRTIVLPIVYALWTAWSLVSILILYAPNHWVEVGLVLALLIAFGWAAWKDRELRVPLTDLVFLPILGIIAVTLDLLNHPPLLWDGVATLGFFLFMLPIGRARTRAGRGLTSA
jgi:hypothetical protein